MAWTPLDDPRVEALVSWSAGDERPDVAAAIASMTDMPPRPECAVALGAVAVKAYERVPGVGARDERLGHAVIAVWAAWARPVPPSSSASATEPVTCVPGRESTPHSRLGGVTPRAGGAWPRWGRSG